MFDKNFRFPRPPPNTSFAFMSLLDGYNLDSDPFKFGIALFRKAVSEHPDL
jgi:hypothetical protein